jgi:hypothetical protein
MDDTHLKKRKKIEALKIQRFLKSATLMDIFFGKGRLRS